MSNIVEAITCSQCGAPLQSPNFCHHCGSIFAFSSEENKISVSLPKAKPAIKDKYVDLDMFEAIKEFLARSKVKGKILLKLFTYTDHSELHMFYLPLGGNTWLGLGYLDFHPYGNELHVESHPKNKPFSNREAEIQVFPGGKIFTLSYAFEEDFTETVDLLYNGQIITSLIGPFVAIAKNLDLPKIVRSMIKFFS